jgi:hypothetical protein
LWRVLAIANVATLGFCCVLLQLDLKHWFPVLTPLVFLKSCASIGFGIHFLVEPMPSYLAACVFDGVTVGAMLFFAIAAKRELDSGDPGLHNVVLRRPDVVKQTLAALERRGDIDRVPTLWQVVLGAGYMRYRLAFRSDTVGVGGTPARTGWRPWLLDWRVIRLPFLLRERCIAPLEMTGLSLSPDFLERHLLAAYHRVDHGIYDLQLLSLHPGRLERLHVLAVDAAEGRTGRGRWLADLCVYQGYHRTLVGLVEQAMAGDFSSADQQIPSDASLGGWLRWCVHQPTTPTSTWAAWQSGQFNLDPRSARPVPSALLIPR